MTSKALFQLFIDDPIIDPKVLRIEFDDTRTSVDELINEVFKNANLSSEKYEVNQIKIKQNENFCEIHSRYLVQNLDKLQIYVKVKKHFPQKTTIILEQSEQQQTSISINSSEFRTVQDLLEGVTKTAELLKLGLKIKTILTFDEDFGEYIEISKDSQFESKNTYKLQLLQNEENLRRILPPPTRPPPPNIRSSPNLSPQPPTVSLSLMTESKYVMNGIAYHRKIMDHYYIYTDLKTKNDGIAETKRDMCEQYLAVITECLNCIDKLPFGDTRRNFLDWLRWNKLLIVTELLQFKEDFGSVYGLTIDGITNRLFKLLETAFVFTEAEKGESNEYAQAFAIIQRKEEAFQNVSVLLIQQASRLLITYINLLTRKCYTKTFDRIDYSFQTLQGEVEYLVSALKRNSDYQLAYTVEETYKAYCEFCEIDEKAMAEQDEQIKIALEAAHKRATETFYEHVIREIQERIQEIQAAASVKAGDVWSGMKLAHRGRPSDHLCNFLQMFKHPIKTVKKIKEFAVENPWKFTGIVLGGVAIGVGAGIIGGAAGLAVGAILFHCPLLAIACGGTVGLIVTPCLAIAGGAGLGLVAGALSVMNNVNKQIEKVRNETEKQVAIEQAKIAALKLKHTQDRNRIIEDAEFNKIRRNTLEQTEEEIKKCKEFMNNVQSEQREKFERMSKKELNKSEMEMSDGIKQLAEELTRTQHETRECNQRLTVFQSTITKTCERRALVVRKIQSAKEGYN